VRVLPTVVEMEQKKNEDGEGQQARGCNAFDTDKEAKNPGRDEAEVGR